MKQGVWIVDIYPSKKVNVYRKIKYRYDTLTEKEGKYGLYWVAEIPDDRINREEKYFNRKGIKYKKYKPEWSRSSDYRKQFLKKNKPPYRCRYCNRRLKKDYMQVDHLISINQVKTSKRARRLLEGDGCSNVNDVKNLVPSCYRCNARKGDKLGVWYLKGKLGRYQWYWILRRITIIIIW